MQFIFTQDNISTHKITAIGLQGIIHYICEILVRAQGGKTDIQLFVTN